MKKQCSGFIFCMTLCIILVISLLVIIGMQQALAYYKVMNRQEKSHYNFYQLEHSAMNFVHFASLKKKNCTLQDVGANEAIKRVINGECCAKNTDEYRYCYLIEDLGEFSCLLVAKQGQKYNSHHFRVTLLQNGQDNSFGIIQLRFIKLGSNLPVCSEEEIMIKEGVISWRYLSDRKNYTYLIK
ncbi:hypothetical protein EP47_13250 [Legionella norrlandica]|uniref:Type 4 fimbrial biogenesis protein PilX N-terminal domain-containing protein n=1 Tax=Legionella norrlandica TaxID=1498499 RepID=A0A0A2T4S7_9GAMM|nr:hypothetical protein [Legionella norrlandica]KGP62393.1 hypothetical protein EP47_13250 [Legionella norrlandica]